MEEEKKYELYKASLLQVIAEKRDVNYSKRFTLLSKRRKKYKLYKFADINYSTRFAASSKFSFRKKRELSWDDTALETFWEKYKLREKREKEQTGQSESSVRFFAKSMVLFKKQNENVPQSKYCPSLFSHLSGSKRIPRRKNDSSLETIQRPIFRPLHKN